MKAAVVHSFTEPLTIEDVPVPTPGPEQVLVRIEASGLCHTDIHAARGEWPVKPEPPFIPGHEAVGVIEQVGAGNDHGLSTGMRVAIPWLGYACGDCGFCNSGRETLCEHQQNTGYSINGGFAEYAVGYARHVVVVPDGIDPADAAPLTCAGVTTYKAVKESGARSADLVAVFGAGGLGHMAVQYAKVTGAEVVAVDINPERLETARRLGVDHVVHAGEQDPVAAIQRLGGAQAAISTAVNPIAFEQAMGSLARGGTLVCVGLPAENAMKLPIFETVLGGLTLKGSIVGTHQDLVEVFDLHRRGKTQVERADARLEDVNESIAAILDGSAGAARTVFRLQEAPLPTGAAHHAVVAG
ncbi:Alcohol dehydrogenase [Patulibacter medicamentivorans]|uniref:Alcohol dehydrogenase n=1 Tax=Patulibacter medicamentivorans TaxID=1097667 RepID=H0E180_9ACTN|nr:zinc-dependent alcohol dehydrogenase [Patulibacter medicamentivorans]EHN12519.1 Alcohol dehydrogenase [Patulibacter medicamentivorans]